MTTVADKEMLALAGMRVPSSRNVGADLRLERVLGQGSQGVVYLAQRQQDGEVSPCVCKLLRPRAIRQLAGRGNVTIEKEVAALERLSRSAATPHVVRFLDAGMLRIGESTLELPWVAMEHVEGGEDGTSLRARVETAIRRTGHAFTLDRAQRAIRAMFAGVSALHALGMVHRDISPGNVLCTGAGTDELFKISDFGLARVADAATFGNVLLGTPGYCAPEQSFPDKVGVGTYTDVFGLGCTIYYLLTGSHYLSAESIPETLVAAYAPARPSLLDAAGLCPTLRGDEQRVRALDEVLAAATVGDPGGRIRTVGELAERLSSKD